jgi:hypothetical protein
LRGYRLTDEGYVPIEPDATGGLICEQLSLRLCLEAGELVIYDLETGKPLLTEAGAERAAREAAETEVQRLRKLLDEREHS